MQIQTNSIPGAALLPLDKIPVAAGQISQSYPRYRINFGKGTHHDQSVIRFQNGRAEAPSLQNSRKHSSTTSHTPFFCSSLSGFAALFSHMSSRWVIGVCQNSMDSFSPVSAANARKGSSARLNRFLPLMQFLLPGFQPLLPHIDTRKRKGQGSGFFRSEPMHDSHEQL